MACITTNHNYKRFAIINFIKISPVLSSFKYFNLLYKINKTNLLRIHHISINIK